MTPTWLTDFLAGLMLAVAAYCAGRLITGGRRGGGTEFDVDGAHVLMGVAMAGMLLSRLSFLSNRVWETLFAIGAAWFAVRAATALRQAAAGRMGAAHLAQYAIACGAMLYMYLAPVVGGGTGSARSGGSGMAGMSASMSAAAGTGTVGAVGRYPTIGLVLALVLVGYAVMTTDRTPLTIAASSVGTGTGTGGDGAGDGTRHARGPLAPRAANCCHIAMSVTMAYMLVMFL
jgi:Domain of unknown function (DUF5134)